MVQLDTTGLAPGEYTVTLRVQDGVGGAADCSTVVTVQPPPPSPQASKLNECSFQPMNSARVDNVCKRILDDVAVRLQNEPRASLVIIGYSDPKERNAGVLAGSRANNALMYLAEHNVETSRVTVRAGSGQQGAGDANRRIDAVWVPEGATY